jgi:hypothetical protein
MTFCFYLQNRQIQTGQTGGQWYSDTSPFSIPWPSVTHFLVHDADVSRNSVVVEEEKSETAQTVLNRHDDDLALGAQLSRIYGIG